MKKIFKTYTMTIAAVVMALILGATANAGGPHFGFSLHLPLPPLPPVPTPFGFVDVNPRVYYDTPTVHLRTYAPAPYYRGYYGPTYAPAYRHVYRERYVTKHRHIDRHDRRQAYRDWRSERNWGGDHDRYRDRDRDHRDWRGR